MGKEFVVNTLEEMCDLMCDNVVPEEKKDDAIKELERHKEEFASDHGWNTSVVDAIEEGIKALATIGDIKKIIGIDYFTIQEDVLKYKMICEVVDKYFSDEMKEQEPKTGHCKDCKWWRDSDGVYRRGFGAESHCPVNTHAVYCGEGYCYMFEPQERSEE